MKAITVDDEKHCIDTLRILLKEYYTDVKVNRQSALDYLLKPAEASELKKGVKKVAEECHLALAEQFQMLLKHIQGKEHHFNKLALPTAEGFEIIPPDQVIRCKADDNYTHLYLKNKTTIVVCRTLKEVEGQLQDFNFFIRVHHSHIVNLNEVIRYVKGEGGYLVLSDGACVNVSKSRKEMLLHTLLPGKPNN